MDANWRIRVIGLPLLVLLVVAGLALTGLGQIRVGADGPPFRAPFFEPPGLGTWYVVQWYGNTTGGYRGRNSTYVQGQGIHFGIDLATACGRPVVAVGDGVVIAVDGDYGSAPHNVVVQHPNGYQSMYGHLLQRSAIGLGTRVQAGDAIGLSGDSVRPSCDGNPHLHLEIRKNGRSVATNPVPLVDIDWEAATLGRNAGFERDLDDPRKWQSIYDQPDITFGGALINNYPRAWP